MRSSPVRFGLTGRSVRCIRCGHTWFAANMAALGAIAKNSSRRTRPSTGTTCRRNRSRILRKAPVIEAVAMDLAARNRRPPWGLTLTAAEPAGNPHRVERHGQVLFAGRRPIGTWNKEDWDREIWSETSPRSKRQD